MNEKIRELAEQSSLKVNFWKTNPPTPFLSLTTYEQLEKFAELIVKECAQVCRDQPEIYALKADRDNCAIAIEQHFGVE